MRWDHARILIDWADALRSRAEPADLATARLLLEESLGLFQMMDTPRYAEVAQERLERLSLGT
jgi:hypothetical protein